MKSKSLEDERSRVIRNSSVFMSIISFFFFFFFFTIWYQSRGECDGSNAATATNEDKLRELEHSNESSSRFSRCMGGGVRRFRRTKRYHGLYGGTKQGVERGAIKG